MPFVVTHTLFVVSQLSTWDGFKKAFCPENGSGNLKTDYDQGVLLYKKGESEVLCNKRTVIYLNTIFNKFKLFEIILCLNSKNIDHSIVINNIGVAVCNIKIITFLLCVYTVRIQK